MSFHIPENEIRFEFVRSGGAGGQNVNKVATKAQLYWNVRTSHALTDEQKARIEKKLGNRMNWKGEIVLAASSERTQAQNRDRALRKLQSIVKKALYVPKARRQTKPTFASREKRLDSKKKRGEVKKKRSGWRLFD